MTNSIDPAGPAPNFVTAVGYEETIKQIGWTQGLTKREYFAAKAMQGLLAGSQGDTKWTENQFAIGSINLADALITELNK